MNESENLWNADSLLKLSEDLQAESGNTAPAGTRRIRYRCICRCAKAEITDMLHAIDDSRTRAEIQS